ncbi:MAG: aspartate 1-decarboxylase [Actinobacteria bacterium]|nr:aspartate 1-decarboxylase [Actinomycetota bacterium]
MFLNILKSKIHRATVTDAQIHYTGSITIDSLLMQRAGLLPFEKVLVVCVESGERLETYVIEGERGSGEICINGAAARKILKGDTIIIMSFMLLDEKEAKTHRPVILNVDKNNMVVSVMEKSDSSDEC